MTNNIFFKRLTQFKVMRLLQKNTTHYDAIDCVQCTELPGSDTFIEVHLFKEPMEQKSKKNITDNISVKDKEENEEVRKNEEEVKEVKPRSREAPAEDHHRINVSIVFLIFVGAPISLTFLRCTDSNLLLGH